MAAAVTVPPRLGIAAAAMGTRLMRGDAVTGQLRTELITLLGDMVATCAGRPQARLSADPAAAIELLVRLARDAGMSGIDLAATFNDTIERV